MKRFKLELALAVVAVVVVAVMLTCSAGCGTARGNRAAGGSIITAVCLIDDIDSAKLRLAYGYLGHIENLLRTDTSAVPQVLAGVLTAELANYGTVTDYEERLVLAVMIDLMCTITPPGEDAPLAYVEDVPEQLADVVAGMRARIEMLLGIAPE